VNNAWWSTPGPGDAATGPAGVFPPDDDQVDPEYDLLEQCRQALDAAERFLFLRNDEAFLSTLRGLLDSITNYLEPPTDEPLETD